EVKAEVKPEVKAEVKPEVKAEVKPEVKPEATLSQTDLEAKTVQELRELAKEMNITGYSKLRKAELIDVLLK
ncbi:MAG: Rho termination factor N-terminal domain-containing protein, partial [Candidatus Izemoplasmatales bacterium]|nr:Rho termination factor N-terminal domain-containing protein [Candidatus Izemoplasmatales bacterium]